MESEFEGFDFNQLRSIVERSLFVAQEQGMISEAESGWQYVEGSQIISYDPQSDELSFVDSETRQAFHWREGEILGSPEISADDIAEFQQVAQWLDSQAVPYDIDLSESVSIDSLPDGEASNSLMQAAAQLFEHYAASGETAFSVDEASPIDYYSVELGDTDYIISRNAETGEYNLQSQSTDLNLNQPGSITQQDVTAWADVSSWLAEASTYAETAESTESAEADTYWENHAQYLAEIQPIAQQFLEFQESVGESGIDLDQQRYGTEIGNYQISYIQEAGQVEISRDGENLAEPGNLTAQDVTFFRDLSTWLSERSFANSSAEDRSNQDFER